MKTKIIAAIALGLGIFGITGIANACGPCVAYDHCRCVPGYFVYSGNFVPASVVCCCHGYTPTVYKGYRHHVRWAHRGGYRGYRY